MVYHEREVPAAIERLAHLDVVVIDTPGRATSGDWVAALERFSADEVHLVLPAGLQHRVMRRLYQELESTGITHALFTKMDQMPDDVDVAAVADVVGIPVRWLGGGYQIPGHLAPATTRILEPRRNPYEAAGSISGSDEPILS